MQSYQQESPQSFSFTPENLQLYEQQVASAKQQEQPTVSSAQPAQQPHVSYSQQPMQSGYYPPIMIVNQNTNTNTATAHATATAQATVQVKKRKSLDYSPLIGAIYFLFIGSWLGLFWAMLGLFMCATIILLPVGLNVLRLLPAVTLLHRG